MLERRQSAPGGQFAAAVAAAGVAAEGAAAMSASRQEPEARVRLCIVVLTHNRCDEVVGTLQGLQRNAPGVPLVVVDNGSSDGTAERIRHDFPQVELIRAPGNLGAAGRNLGAKAAQAEYLAFCDDDVCWLPGSLERALSLLEQHPDIAVLSARVMVGAAAMPDPACAPMARSPLPGEPDIGPALVGFMAGACVMRAEAFHAAGGYWPPLFLGSEESLLALDLLEDGWRILYAPDIAAHHHPSAARDAVGRRRLLARNALWVAWLRLPVLTALAESRRILRAVPGWRERRQILREAFGEWHLIASHRRPVGRRVCHLLSTVRKAG